MYAAISPSSLQREGDTPGIRLQRTSGRLRLDIVADADGRSRLHTLLQEGAFKARLPAVPGQDRPQVVLINTAGGLTGGDVLSARIGIGGGAVADITTQASEKIYRSTGDEVRVDTVLEVAGGGMAHWLPEETILFDGARLKRSLTVNLADGARLLACESMVFGRTARGERVHDGLFQDRWRVRRGGRLVFADAVRFENPIHAALERKAVADGGVAVATLLYVADDGAARVDAVRAVLAGHDCDAGASAYDGLLVCRLVACTGAVLRQALVPVLESLRDGRALPRPWFC